jgi:acyl transferase domain-containing protein
VKSGIGHLEAAAGIAGLTKVMLQMRHRQLVPTLHAARTNPNLDFAGTPFRLQQELTPWQPGQDENGDPRARIAGVSSFGAGGANAHVIIEEWPSPDFVATQNPRTEEVPAQTAVHPVLLSARDGERLRESAALLLAALDSWTSGPVAATEAPLAREALTAHVRELLAQILSVSSDDLDDEESFDSIGIEAVQRQALRHALEQRFDLNLSPAMFHEVSTVVQAASLVAQQLGSGDSQPLVAAGRARGHGLPPGGGGRIPRGTGCRPACVAGRRDAAGGLL